MLVLMKWFLIEMCNKTIKKRRVLTNRSVPKHTLFQKNKVHDKNTTRLKDHQDLELVFIKTWNLCLSRLGR